MSGMVGQFFMLHVFHFSELFIHVFCPLSSWGPSVFLSLTQSFKCSYCITYLPTKTDFLKSYALFHFYLEISAKKT